jgi:hypothetical protein
MTAPQPDAAYEAIDAMFALAVRTCRLLTDRHFSPLLVEMRRPAPAERTPFHKCFRAPIQFGADRNAMTLDKATCDKRLRSANPELARANDLIAAQAIERWDQSHLANRVRVVLLNRLPTGAPSPLETARVLGTSGARAAAPPRGRADVVHGARQQHTP